MAFEPSPYRNVLRGRLQAAVPKLRLSSTRRAQIRWFAAEFFVVVAGVLVALALNTWWLERENRRSERAYLLQLVGDASTNEQLLQQALTDDSASLRALAGLAWHLQTESPPAGSGMAVMGTALRYSDPRPVLGTADHLIGTGRAELLRSDSVRLALIEYASLMHSDLAELSRHVNLLMTSMGLWVSRQQSAGLDCAMFVEVPGRIPTCDQQVKELWPALSRDPQYRSAILGARISAWNRVFYLERMLQDTRRMRAVLELELVAAQ